jgi:hypothetical protein
MDIKRAKELIIELTNLIDQIEGHQISVMNKMPELHEIEIKTKIMAILNELDIRPIEIGLREEF